MPYSGFPTRCQSVLYRPCGRNGLIQPGTSIGPGRHFGGVACSPLRKPLQAVVFAILLGWACVGCKRDAPPATLPPGVMEAPKPGSATPSAPGTALRSEEAAPPDQDSVPGHNPTPQELVGESGQVPMDAYDSLAFSLDSAEPEGLEVFRNPTAYDSLPGQLLTTGERHGEEVPDDADKHEWLGVFINEDVCRIAPTRVQIERIPDPFGGGDDNGKQVKALVEGSVAFLVRDVEGLEAGHCVVEKNPWEYQTGGRFAIRHQGTSYLLAVTRHPSIRIRSEHGEAIPVLRVFLTRKDPGGDSTALILRLVGTEGFTIHWLGDFDGDGLLDLVLDDQGNYNAETTTLFLSRPAAPGRMLKRIASYTITGC